MRLLWPVRSWEVGAMMGAEDGGRVVVLLEKGLEDVDVDVAVVAVDVAERREKVLLSLLVLEVESLELCRDLRRKGREGARKVGKNARLAWGSEARRK
jgi:hypothetical protein